MSGEGREESEEKDEGLLQSGMWVPDNQTPSNSLHNLLSPGAFRKRKSIAYVHWV